jgi:predicted PurR-regulated permease PerM
MKRIRPWVRYLAMAGDVAYILWIVYNAVDDGFRTRGVELVALTGLLLLLVLNIVLLSRRER